MRLFNVNDFNKRRLNLSAPVHAVPCSDQGFTVLESLIVVAIVLVLSAIAAPGLLGWYSRFRTHGAIAEVQSAIHEAKRQAFRNSRNCMLNFAANQVSGSCLVTGNRQFEGVSLQSSVNSLQVGIKGTIANANGQPLTAPVTIVISSNRSVTRPCLVVSAPLGLVRTGTYSGTGTPTENNCLP
ncbi:prepilin-type N-terminal cleavage/methylation domain-containing protein [Oscillatoria sp. FACHB-1407]|uniref:pilus assembly FimT family protein n=1 Tax=Oscillatoria sp. FACHB-1407 TaxID=2692847 RepID=UPI0016820723|nr:prepilin-type N-terminal cleavage/methylation domain-containing protein [Oscillatoria sp. FACHB-1407]MBD2459741.1 prepilin-type N-terminal cleavage/methylation domain-containing protein [Oscillatoria sp. FACHB-1407]